MAASPRPARPGAHSIDHFALEVPDLVLAGLMLATGLDQQVLYTLEARERGYLFDQLRRRLPAMLQELIAHAEAAVGDAVMARRA